MALYRLGNSNRFAWISAGRLEFLTMMTQMRWHIGGFVIAATLLCLGNFILQHPEGIFLDAHNQPGGTVLQEIDERSKETAAQAAALYHLAGGKKMLEQKTPEFGSKSLDEKNQDALNLLSDFFDKKDSKKGPKDSAKKPEASRGRFDTVPSDRKKSESVDQHRLASKQEPIEESGPDSEESPNEALQNLIAGWSGAGWWKPCAEVCRPRIGTKHTNANMKIFTTCEHQCRTTKTKRLKDVMSHIAGAVRSAAKNSAKTLAPRTIQKLSKHLIKWAESNGLPTALATDANTNLADNQKVGEAITGMLIAGWSGAGWWKPCGEICRPGPDEPHTKANFDKFMACENSCRQEKAEYLQAFLSPKNLVKALAHAKLLSNSTAKSARSSGSLAANEKTATDAEESSPSTDDTTKPAAAPPHSAKPAVAPSHSEDIAAKASQPSAGSEKGTSEHKSQVSGEPQAPLTKKQKLIKWAEAHGLPKSLADNPDDKLKVKHIIARMKADLAVERIKAQMAKDTEKVSDAVRTADPEAEKLMRQKILCRCACCVCEGACGK